MKNTFKVLGIIAFVAVIVITTAGCGSMPQEGTIFSMRHTAWFQERRTVQGFDVDITYYLLDVSYDSTLQGLRTQRISSFALVGNASGINITNPIFTNASSGAVFLV